ncbi:hypothetical protein P0Y43_14945 [Pseudomonas entomophila]|uniref:DUF7693 family protein n=1 Tax=Pseudomonas entomophila TaxID=312306 RepID=UPI0023D7CD08|nr:hypothetical protein [Pseudomonas entomophila]MDF0732010.1 hypothetical protein [Pseudomonas entomophila]
MPAPSTRAVYQCLRDAALGARALVVLDQPGSGLFEVAIDGWRLTLACDGEGLAHCLHCRDDEGQTAGLEDWQRYGTNPTDLLSIWERGRIERLLAPQG